MKGLDILDQFLKMNGIENFVRHDSTVFVLMAHVLYSLCVNKETKLSFLCDAVDIVVCTVIQKYLF